MLINYFITCNICNQTTLITFNATRANMRLIKPCNTYYNITLIYIKRKTNTILMIYLN